MINPDNLPYRTRLVLASEDIFDLWGTRTIDGERITVEWGERKPEGWYEPTFTRHGDDRLPDAAELDRLRRIEAAARILIEPEPDIGSYGQWLDSAPVTAWTKRQRKATRALRAALQPEGSARDGG